MPRRHTLTIPMHPSLADIIKTEMLTVRYWPESCGDRWSPPEGDEVEIADDVIGHREANMRLLEWSVYDEGEGANSYHALLRASRAVHDGAVTPEDGDPTDELYLGDEDAGVFFRAVQDTHEMWWSFALVDAGSFTEELPADVFFTEKEARHAAAHAAANWCAENRVDYDGKLFAQLVADEDGSAEHGGPQEGTDTAEDDATLERFLNRVDRSATGWWAEIEDHRLTNVYETSKHPGLSTVVSVTGTVFTLGEDGLWHRETSAGEA